MKIFKNIKLASNVEGFLTNREGSLLYSVAYVCKNLGVIVEIGSWKGKSTVWIANGVKDKGSSTKIYAIDPHGGVLKSHEQNIHSGTFEDFQNNMKKAGVQDLIVPIVKTSKDARKDFNQAIEFLFIDGLHEFEYVDEDYRLWSNLVIDNGYIAFHDSPIPGVSKVIEKAFTEDNLKIIYFTDTLMVGQKVKSMTSKDKFNNKAMLALNRQFHAACVSKSPKIIRKIWKDAVKLGRGIMHLL